MIMGSLNIFGSSDDRVETEGDLSEQWTHPDAHQGADVRVSSGDTVRVAMGLDGAWSASHIVQPTGSRMDLTPNREGNDGDQLAVLVTPDPIAWVEVVLPDGTLLDPGRITVAGVRARSDADTDEES